MKRIIFLLLGVFILMNSSVYALETNLADIRNKIFEESKVIKLALTKSKDVLLLNSLWDSCLMTMTQLDAYFHMLGIFNTIKTENLSEDATNYLTNWLNALKKVNELNIKSLNAISTAIEANTQLQIKKLKDYFSSLNSQIDKELSKISLLKKSSEIKTKK